MTPRMYREPTRGHQWRAYPRSLPPSTTPVVVDWLSTLIKRGWGLPPRQRLCVVAIALAVVSILATTFLVQLIIVAVVASFLALRELIITTSIVPWQQRIRFCDESKDLLDRVILIPGPPCLRGVVSGRELPIALDLLGTQR